MNFVPGTLGVISVVGTTQCLIVDQQWDHLQIGVFAILGFLMLTFAAVMVK